MQIGTWNTNSIWQEFSPHFRLHVSDREGAEITFLATAPAPFRGSTHRFPSLKDPRKAQDLAQYYRSMLDRINEFSPLVGSEEPTEITVDLPRSNIHLHSQE